MKNFFIKCKLLVFYLAYNYRFGRLCDLSNRLGFICSTINGFLIIIEELRWLSILTLIVTVIFLFPYFLRLVSYLILFLTGDRRTGNRI